MFFICAMDPFVTKQLYEHSFIFKRSLDQIVEKYSKLQGGGIEVNLNDTKPDALERYINLSLKELNKLQSKNLIHLSEESLSAQDITGDSQVDITYKDGGADETCGSTNQCAGEDEEASLSLLDAGLKSFSEGELQPEDQDEELQMSLSSNGSSLVELYPGMVCRLEKAWHQQHVSVAADSVLRRYRRWRQQSKRRDLNNTFDVTLKHTNGNPKRLTSKGLFKERNSGIKRQLVKTEATPHSALQTVLRRERPAHVCVMDFSGIHEPKESLLNETFTVCELSPPKLPQRGEHVSTYTARPSQHHHASAEASVEPSFRLKRFSDPSHSSQEPMRPRSLSSSLSSCTERPVVQLKLLQPSQPPLRSPHSATAADDHHRRIRHRSFDSSLPPNPASYSPKKVDEDFIKVYHKFACLNKSFFNGPPCRLCTRNSETSQSQSSSALAALALSPHRSVLRKRYRDWEWGSHSQSKRFREEHCTSSPGSKRHGREMLRRRLSLADLELPRGGLFYSPSKRRVQHDETWTSQHRPACDYHFPGQGGSLENRGTSGYSPR